MVLKLVIATVFLFFQNACFAIVNANSQDDSEDLIFGRSPDEDFKRDNILELKPNSAANSSTPANTSQGQNPKPIDIKNDISPQKTFPQKQKNELAQSFETNPKNFTSEKQNLEEDAGYFSNKEQAIENKKIPKYPDRSSNKGLVKDLYSILDNKDDGGKSKIKDGRSLNATTQKSNETQLPPQQEERPDDGIFSFFKKITQKASGIASDLFKKDEQSKIDIKPKQKFNLADKFPDPTFYKTQRIEKYYKIPLSILNDKTNPENMHIPTVDLSREYKILYLLFDKIKQESNQGEIRAMLNEIKNKNLINTKDEFGNTLLNYAVRFNNLQSFHALMDYGANPNICNASGICPIHLAIFNYQNYVFDLLLKSRIKYDIKDNSGLDPLVYSIYAGNGYAFFKLLQYEPYSNLQQSDFLYLLDMAKDGENYEIYNYIKNRSN